MTTENENAAHWVQPVDGEQRSVLTTDHYHDFQAPATQTEIESAVIAANSGLRLRLLRGNAAAEPAFEAQLRRLTSLIAFVLHDGIEHGGVEEALRRCELLQAEVELSARALAATKKRLTSELL